MFQLNLKKDNYDVVQVIDGEKFSEITMGCSDVAESILDISNDNISTSGRCGLDYGKCPSGQCCSKNDKCGTKATTCSKQNGCQPKYGKCKNIKIVTKKKVVKKLKPKRKTITKYYLYYRCIYILH